MAILSLSSASAFSSAFFFFNDTATTEIYTLSLHDALPISALVRPGLLQAHRGCVDLGELGLEIGAQGVSVAVPVALDRKSTRLNSSHLVISYAVFCLKKKKTHRLLSHDTVVYDELGHCSLY